MQIAHERLEDITDVDVFFNHLGKLALLVGTTEAFSQVQMEAGLSLINGALRNRTYALYQDDKGKPTAALIWAFLDEPNTDHYIRYGILPNIAAWRSGKDAWLLNVIAERGTIRAVVNDLKTNIFKDHKEVFVLRPSPDGTRRIVRFTHTGTEVVRTLPKPLQR